MRAWWHSKTAGASHRGSGRVVRVPPHSLGTVIAHQARPKHRRGKRGRSKDRTRKGASHAQESRASYASLRSHTRQSGAHTQGPSNVFPASWNSTGKPQAFHGPAGLDDVLSTQAGVAFTRVTGPPANAARRYAQQLHDKAAGRGLGLLVKTHSSKYLLGSSQVVTMEQSGVALAAGPGPGVGGFRSHSAVSRSARTLRQEATSHVTAGQERVMGPTFRPHSSPADATAYTQAFVTPVRTSVQRMSQRSRSSPRDLPPAHGTAAGSPSSPTPQQAVMTPSKLLSHTMPSSHSFGREGKPRHPRTAAVGGAGRGHHSAAAVRGALGPAHGSNVEPWEAPASGVSVGDFDSPRSPDTSPDPSRVARNVAATQSGTNIARGFSMSDDSAGRSVTTTTDSQHHSSEATPSGRPDEGVRQEDVPPRLEDTKQRKDDAKREANDQLSVMTAVLASFRIYNQELVEDDSTRIKQAQFVRQESVRRMAMPDAVPRAVNVPQVDLEDIGECVDVGSDSGADGDDEGIGGSSTTNDTIQSQDTRDDPRPPQHIHTSSPKGVVRLLCCSSPTLHVCCE